MYHQLLLLHYTDNQYINATLYDDNKLYYNFPQCYIEIVVIRFNLNYSIIYYSDLIKDNRFV